MLLLPVVVNITRTYNISGRKRSLQVVSVPIIVVIRVNQKCSPFSDGGGRKWSAATVTSLPWLRDHDKLQQRNLCFPCMTAILGTHAGPNV